MAKTKTKNRNRWKQPRKHKKIPRHLQYDLQTLEPRLLFSAALYDPGDGGGSGDSDVATNIETQLTDTFTFLGKYADEIGTEEAADSSAVPFFQSSVEDLLGFEIEDFLKGGSGSDAYSQVVDDYFDNASPDSTGLAADLQSAVQNTFGVGSVTDTGSDNDNLILNFSIDLNEVTKDLKFGTEAQEFFLEYGAGAQVKFNADAITFSIKADLSGVDNVATDETDNSSNDSLYSVEFGGSDKDTLSIMGSSSHTNSLDPLTGFGVGFGLIDARDDVMDSGGYVANTGGTFSFNLQLDFILESSLSADSKLSLDELRAIDTASSYESIYRVDTPTGAGVNEGELFLPIQVANPAGDEFISGIDGITGDFTFTDNDLFDSRSPLVQASDQTLASFSRMTADDLLQFVKNATYLFGQSSDLTEMQNFLPLLDLNLGQAYDFLEASEKALVDPLVIIENVLRIKDAPSTSGDPLDYTGNSSFQIYVFYQGVLEGGALQIITLNANSSRASLQDVADDLNIALAAAAAGTQRVFARVTETASPRLELYGVDADTTFFISSVNPSGETLDLGIDPYGLVFARNNGTISSNQNEKYQLQEVKVESSTAIEVSHFTTLKTFTVAIGSDSATTITLPPSVYGSMADFVFALQSALAEAGVYDASTGEGIEVDEATSGDSQGFGVTFSISGSRSGETLTLGGSDVGIFQLSATSGASSYTSATPVELSPFESGLSLTISFSSQQAGLLATTTETISIPAGKYASVDDVIFAIREALQSNGLYDAFTNTGILIEKIPVGGGEGIRFYTSAEVYELTISTSSNSLIGLSSTSESATAAYIDIDVKQDGNASATTTRVYINGNTTTDLLGNSTNTSVSDFVSDVQSALTRAGLRDSLSGTGVDIRSFDQNGSSTDYLEFFALNPGAGSGFIQEISTGASASFGMDDYNLDGLAAQVMALSAEDQKPRFSNVQEFVALLNQSTGLPQVSVDLNGSADGVEISRWSANTTSVEVTGGTGKGFLNLDADLVDNANTEITSSSAVDLSNFTVDTTLFVSVNGAAAVTATIKGDTYNSMADLVDAISIALREAGLADGLLSSPAVYNGGDIVNGVSPYFTFPIHLYVDEYFGDEGLADLTDVDMRFESSYGETATGQISNLSAEKQVTVSRSSEISFDLGLNLIQPKTSSEELVVELPVIIQDWDGQLDSYDALFKVILDDGVVHDVLVLASDTALNTSTEDFVANINAALSAVDIGGGVMLSSLVVASLDMVNDFERDVIRFTTVAGSSRSLAVEVPEYISEDTTYNNDAAVKLGFTTNVSTGNLDDFDVLAGATQIDASGVLPNNPDYDVYYRVKLEDSVTGATDAFVFSTKATDTSGNTNLAQLIVDINNAHSSVDFEAFDNGGNLGFQILGVNYDIIRVDVAKNQYLATETDPIIADNPVDVSDFVLATDAFFEFILPDGTSQILTIEVEDTTDNASLDDLVNDLNQAIQATSALMDNGVYQKIIAFIEGVGGNNHLAFRLDTTNVYPSGGDWRMTVIAQYNESVTNAASFELAMAEETYRDTRYALIGPIIGSLADADSILVNDFLLDISINGSDYETVTVLASDTSANTSIGDLIADINTSLANTSITVAGNSYTVSQFIDAIALSGGDVVQLAVRDDAPVPLLNVRFDPTTDSNNGYIDLGFSSEESQIGIRGSDATLDNIFLTGRAEVRDADVSGKGSLGFADFSFDHTDFDAITETTLGLTGNMTSMLDLMRYLGSYEAEYSAVEIDHSLTIEDDTFARVEFQDLAFLEDSVTENTLTGLTFDPTSTIVLAYQPNGNGASSSIGVGGSDLFKLPEADLSFNNTNDIELISRLTFDDIALSLWHVGDFISDWMNNDPNGPFAANLFFAKTGIVDVQDFGEEFSAIMAQLWANPPENLQEVQRALESGLNLDAGDVTVELVTSGSGSTFNASLRVAFDFITTFASTLPLYIDLAMLSDRSSNSGLVKQSLLGLSSLSSSLSDPMEVELEGLSKLQLDMDLVLVENGEVIEPKAILNQPNSGEFFETKFFVTGDSYTGDLPAGANRLRLGYSWFDETGREVLAPDTGTAPVGATVATTGELAATYDDATDRLTSTSVGALVVDGITLTEQGSDGAPGDYVLVKDQSDPTQNGLYEVIESGDGATAWILERTDSDLSWLKVSVNSGSIFGDRIFMVKDISNVDVVAAATTSVGNSYNLQSYPFLNYIDAGSSLTIDGVTPEHGDFVLLTGQQLGSTGAPNGVYQVQINSGTYELYLMDIGQGTIGQADVTGGSLAGNSYFVDFNNITNNIQQRGVAELTPYNVVELRSAAVAVSEGGEVALPDVNGTPQIYDTDETTLDENDIPAADFTVEVSTTEEVAGTFSGGTITLNVLSAPVIDGVTLAAGDLVMVNHQGDGSQNGIYQLTESSGIWTLTRVSTYDDLSDTLNVKVTVASGTTYGGFEFKMAETISEFNASIVRFSKLIKPASFIINLSDFNGTKDKQLPYHAVAASTSDLLVSADGSSTASFDLSTGTITADQNGSLNRYVTQVWDEQTGQVINIIGIDGVTNLRVGDRVLLKDIGRTELNPSGASYGSYTGDYRNGIYEVVSLGGSTSQWELKRVDFADEASEFDQLKIGVQRGSYNLDTRYIQTLFNPLSLGAGTNIGFTDDIAFVYGNYDSNGNLVGSWVDFSADGNAAAALPLSVVMVPSGGGETVITKNLASLTDDEKEALGQLGEAILEDDLYLAAPDLDALKIFVADDTDASDDGFAGSGLEKFFDTSDIAVTFDPLPDLFRTVPPSDVLSLVRDWVFMGDALDLALFNLQFAMDQALGIEVPLLGTSLPSYTGFIEEFRDDLTTRVRENLRLDTLKPANAIRDALYAALGPNGLGYLTDITDIVVMAGDTVWDIDNTSDTTFYGTTAEGLLFEKVSQSSLEFSFSISKSLDTDATAVAIDSIESGDQSIGLSISNSTVSQNSDGVVTSTTGGVQLKRSFELNFGFGMDILDGFYIFNPTQTDSLSPPTSDLIEIGIEAQLDGDINTPGIQAFVQSDSISQLNQLSMSVADGRIDYSTDGRASGFFGTYEFNLNVDDTQLATGSHSRVGRNSVGVTTDQLRNNEVLGPESEADTLLNFEINADADIHLLAETARDSLIPSYQMDIIMAKRYGTGYAPLVFDNKLAGLGTSAEAQALGDKIIDAANGVTVEGDADYPTDADFQSSSPDWRVNRDTLTDNAQEGQTFLAFQNITIDIRDYLSGPIYTLLQYYDEGTEEIRPYIEFLTSPVPGTEWMAEPFTVGDFLGPEFQIFLSVISTLDSLLGPVVQYAQVNESGSSRSRVGIGGTSDGISLGVEKAFENNASSSGNKERFDRYDEASDQRAYDEQTRGLLDELPAGESESSSDNRSALSKFGDTLNEKLTTPNKFSEKFEQVRDGDVGWLKNNDNPTGVKDKLLNDVKSQTRDSLESDDQGTSKQIEAGISGGGFQLEALSVNTALTLFNGGTADLLRIEVPQVSVSFTISRYFPLPAFPPLGVTLGFTIEIFVQLSFGFDDRGFYWTDRDTSGLTLEESERIPTFGFAGTFSVGVALNLGLIEAGIEAFFEVGVEFYWNTPENSSKLRQEEINWLFDNGRSLFDIRVYGKVGVEIYVDLTIPIPFVGPITKRIFSQTFEVFLFDEFIDFDSGVIQLAQQSGDTLRLNMGTYASDRIFIDVDDISEVYRIYSIDTDGSANGEDIIVAYYGADRTYYSKYTGIKHIYGYAGDGQTIIDAGGSLSGVDIDFEEGGSFSGDLSALKYASVNFFGGDGSTFLRTAGTSQWGRSRLDAKESSGTLDATQATRGTVLIAGQGNTVIQGSQYDDDIVSNIGSDILRGNGGGDTFHFLTEFGRDRIYVSGDNNTVSFDDGSLSGFAVGGDYVLPTHTVGAKFQFGPLVQSVKLDTHTAFFAVDPSGVDRIDTWVGTAGDDIWNVFYFAPGTKNDPLKLVSNGGSDFYSVFLGDPLKVYNKNADDNAGKISIDDSLGTGTLLLTQTFADSITYSSTTVTNGRELMEMTDIETVNLDAGDSTLFWGSSGTTTDIIGGTITTGRIIMLGDVNLTGTVDVVLNLNRTFTIDHQLNIQNGTSSDWRDVYINIENPNPNLESNLLIGSTGSLLLSDSGSAGDGYGHFYIYVPTGYVQNQNDVSGGIIKATNGYIEIRARNGIGSVASSLQVNSERFSGSTSSSDNFSGLDGIYVYSPEDLNIRASQNLEGVSTVDGAILLEVAAGSKLTYGDIEAGGAKNITLIADDIELAGAYSVDRISTSTSLQTVEKVRYETVWEWVEYTKTVNVLFFSFTYSFWRQEQVNKEITYTVEELVTTTLVDTFNFAAGVGSITGTGQITILNQSDLFNIEVGDTTDSGNPNTLFLTKDVLDSLQTGFQLILIGNAQGTSSSDKETDLVSIKNYAFQDSVRFRGSQIQAGVTSQTLSSEGALEFVAYDAFDVSGGTGSISFVSGALYEALSIVVNADGDIDALGSFTSDAALNGTIIFNAGINDGTGNVTLTGSFNATGTGSTLEAITGSTSGDILIKDSASFNIDEKVTLNANLGTITQESASGRIVVNKLEVLAAGAITIRTDIQELVNAFIDGTGNLTLDELDDLTLTAARTKDGDIDITTGGNLLLGQVYAGVVNTSSIIPGDLHDIMISAGGTVYEVTDSDAMNLFADKLTVNALGDINFDTQVHTVDIESKPTSGTGNIFFKNFALLGASLVAEQILADNGQISVESDTSLIATNIQTNQGSGVTSTTNSITLDVTGDLTVGDISTEGYADSFIKINNGIIQKAGSGMSLVTARNLEIDIISSATTGTDAVNIDLQVEELIALMSGGIGDFRFASETDLVARNIVNLGSGNVFITVANAVTDPSLSVERIDAASGDITLLVDGSLIDLDDGTILDGTGGILTKITGNNLVVVSGGPTSLDTGVSTLDVQVGGVGELYVQEVDALNLNRATTTSGNITFDIGLPGDTSGSLFVDFLSAGGGADDATITTNGGALRTLNTGVIKLLQANVLTATTRTGVGDGTDVLNTDINTLIATVTNAGRININEIDGILLSNLDVQVGSIFIDAGGAIVHDLVTAVDTSGGSSSVAIVDLETTTGAITALNGASLIFAQDLILETPDLINVITNVGTVDALSLVLGDVTILETDDIDVRSIIANDGSVDIDAGGGILVDTITTDDTTAQVDLTAVSGSIGRYGTLGPVLGRIVTNELVAEAATGIAMFSDTNFLTATITGAAGNIEVDELDTLTIRTANTPNGTFDLEVGDRIEVDPAVTLPTPHVVANTSIFNSVNGIATAAGFLNVSADIIDATATASGGIYIYNLKDVELRYVLAEDGEILITNEGNILARDVRTGVDDEANDILLTTLAGTGGDIVIDYIGAGHNGGIPGDFAPFSADVILDSDGAIEGLDPSTIQFLAHVMGERVDLTAETGVGNIFSPIVTARIFSANTTSGSMNFTVATSNTIQFIDSSTGNGTISFTQTGSGDLFATNISANNGGINLAALGGGDMTFDLITTTNGDFTATAGPQSQLTALNINIGGDAEFTSDNMQFLAGPGSLIGSGSLTMRPFSPGVSPWITSIPSSNQFGDPSLLEITERELRAAEGFLQDLIIEAAEGDDAAQRFSGSGITAPTLGESGTNPGFLNNFSTDPVSTNQTFRLVDLLIGSQGSLVFGGDDEESVGLSGITPTPTNLALGFDGPSLEFDTETLIVAEGQGNPEELPEEGNVPPENGDGENSQNQPQSQQTQDGQQQENSENSESENNDDQASVPETSLGVWTAGALLLVPVVKSVDMLAKAKKAVKTMMSLF
ncbi:MAG: hypothetical protein AAGA18_05835 [Verrucomicrobiota bacterium]